jgi:dihydrofolate reductase
MSSYGEGGLPGMGIVKADIAVTVDGFGAGADQSLERPFGELDDDRLHSWMFDHRDENAAEVDAIVGAGAYLMGRNMFSPGRGEWDIDWRGWWGDNPPYHGPVYVLTHHEREPVVMEGGTTFHFVTDGIEAALGLARAAAGDRDISIAGGASTINAYLAIGAVDELRLHVVPYTSGLTRGSRIFDGVPAHGLVSAGARWTPHVTHLTYRRG